MGSDLTRDLGANYETNPFAGPRGRVLGGAEKDQITKQSQTPLPVGVVIGTLATQESGSLTEAPTNTKPLIPGLMREFLLRHRDGHEAFKSGVGTRWRVEEGGKLPEPIVI